MPLTEAQVEDRYQRLTYGIELLNILMAVDVLESPTPAEAKKKQAISMFLLRSQAYSKDEVAKAAYDDLLDFLKDIVPTDGEGREVETKLEVSDSEARNLLTLLRAVGAQKEAASSGQAAVYSYPPITNPATATRSLINELLSKLSS